MWQSLLQQVLLVPAGIGQEGATWTTGVACAGPSRECKSASQAAWLEAAPPSGQRGRPSAGLGQSGGFRPEGAEAPAVPPARQSLPCKVGNWESGGATALGSAGPSTTQSPSRRVPGPLAPQGGRELGQEGGSGKGPACPCPPGQAPRPQRRQESASGLDVAAAPGRIPLGLPASFVRRGLHKMAATALRHFVPAAGRREAGGGGRRETTAPACPGGLAGAQRRPARARPWPGRPGLGTGRHPGRTVGSAGPSLSAARPRAKRTEMLQTRARRSCN